MTGAWRRRSWIVLPWSEKGSGDRAGRLVARDRAHTVVMTGSCFLGDAEPMLEEGFQAATRTWCEWLNRLDVGCFLPTRGLRGRHSDGPGPDGETIPHIPGRTGSLRRGIFSRVA